MDDEDEAEDTLEDGQAGRPVTFGLFPRDRIIQTRLLEACCLLLRRTAPAQTRGLSYLMCALQHLSSVTPSIRGGVDLTTRHARTAAFRGFETGAMEETNGYAEIFG